MSLISTETVTSDVYGDANLITSVHGELHTIVVSRNGSATGTVAVNVVPLGTTTEEPLYDKGSPVVIDVTSPASYAFKGCITEVRLVGTAVTGTYNATLSSHGNLPEGRN